MSSLRVGHLCYKKRHEKIPDRMSSSHRLPNSDSTSHACDTANCDGGASSHTDTCHPDPRTDGNSRAFPDSIPAILYGPI